MFEIQLALGSDEDENEMVMSHVVSHVPYENLC